MREWWWILMVLAILAAPAAGLSQTQGTEETGENSDRLQVYDEIQVTDPWLSIDADLALSRGRFKDSDPVGDRIPGSIEQALSAGISAEGLGRFKNVFGSLRARYFGPRPLLEDDSVRSESSTLVNTELGYRFANGLSLALEVFNLLDETVSDIDYFYESRLSGEAEAVEDVHFHPAEKRSARLVFDWRF